MNAHKKEMRKLRAKLPAKYGRIISDKLEGKLTSFQVTRVMNGEITDANIMIPVLEKVKEVIEEQRKIDALKKDILSDEAAWNALQLQSKAV